MTALTLTLTTVGMVAGIWLAKVAAEFVREYRAGQYMSGVAGYQKIEDGAQVWVAYHGCKQQAIRRALEAAEEYGVKIVVK